MISRMSLVEIVGPKDSLDQAVHAIQEMGVLHVEEIPLTEGDGMGLLHKIHLSEDQAREKKSYGELMELLDEAALNIPAAVLNKLRKSPELAVYYATWKDRPVSAMSGVTRTMYSKVRSFVRRRRNLNDDLRVVSGYEDVVAALAPMIESHELPKDFEFMGVIFERKNRKARGLLEQHLRELTGGESRFFEAGLKDGRTTALLGFHKQFSHEVRTFISEAGISEMRGPRYLRDKPFEEAMAVLERDLAVLKEEYKTLLTQIEEFYVDRGVLILALQHLCRDHFSRLDTFTKFAQTHYTFIIRGWVPRSRVREMRLNLTEVCGESLVVHQVCAEGQGAPPVHLNNSAPLRPFERLLSLFPLPKYGTIDATSLVAVFFPPFFGLMLGDIGYGFVLALGALALYFFGKARSIMRDLGTVLGYCSFFTIVFGFVFGELFGTLGHHWGLRPIWSERLSLTAVDKSSALLGYLAIAVAVGLFHVLYGLALGIVNARRTGERSRVVSCAARMAGLIAMFFLLGRLAKFLPPAFTSLGVIALLIFLVLMIYQTIQKPLHGLLMPLELLSTMGSVLSYARIMAVGMASVVLAILANRFGSMIENAVLAVIVVVLIHCLNLVLGIIDPTIQGLRLHYVEFFSKFYVTGGTRYEPFRRMGGEIA